MPARKKLVCEARQAIDIVALVRSPETVRLRVLDEERLRPRRTGRKQVENFHDVFVRDEDLLRSNIAVDDTFRVRIFQRVADGTKHR